MNEGFFGFPDRHGKDLIDIAQFDQSGAYTISNSARLLTILAVGPGGGGGGGARQAAGVNAFGGGGGAGGRVFLETIPVRDLIPFGKTMRIQIGSGAIGGSGATSDNTSGNSGFVAGDTTVFFYGFRGILLRAHGGGSGSGGTTTNGTRGSGSFASSINNVTVATSESEGASCTAFGASSITVQSMMRTGAASGGIVDSANVARIGGNITTDVNYVTSRLNPLFANSTTVLAGTLANTGGTAPSADTVGPFFFGSQFMHGLGGAGGGSASTTAASNGGNGFRGGGGGGGGGSRNGFNAGSGGRGGNGYVCIWAWG